MILSCYLLSESASLAKKCFAVVFKHIQKAQTRPTRSVSLWEWGWSGVKDAFSRIGVVCRI